MEKRELIGGWNGRLVVFLLVWGLFWGCGKDEGVLPYGEYPVTFMAGIAGGGIGRGTTENNWRDVVLGDEVAVQIDGRVKKYKVDAEGALRAVDGENTHYWLSTGDITVDAWYPYADRKPTVLVRADQSGSGYEESDWLGVSGAVVSFRSPTLTFGHRTAKVVATLSAGEGVADLNGAVVTFVNVEGVDAGTAVKPRTTRNADGTLTCSALLASGNREGQPFIRVEVGGNTYDYTPGVGEATHAESKQYTYAISVEKDRLVVTVTGNGVEWDVENAVTGGPLSTFRVVLAGELPKNFVINGASKGTGEYYETGTDGFTFSYTPSSGEKGKWMFVEQGLCDVAKSETGGPYVQTFSNIRSDMWLKFERCPVVGDYYYSDGTWSEKFTDDSRNPCIGIVFKVEAGYGDKDVYYNSKLRGIRGYVVALKDASAEAVPWSLEGINTGASTSQSDFCGYRNTQIIKNKKGINFDNMYPAASCCCHYIPAAPEGCSGWYLPSCAEIKAFYDVYGTVASKITTAGGSEMQSKSYSTSTEHSASWSYIRINWARGGEVLSDYKRDNRFVRAILTF